MIKWRCDNCNEILEAPDSMQFQPMMCPNCGQNCTVPKDNPKSSLTTRRKKYMNKWISVPLVIIITFVVLAVIPNGKNDVFRGSIFNGNVEISDINLDFIKNSNDKRPGWMLASLDMGKVVGKSHALSKTIQEMIEYLDERCIETPIEIAEIIYLAHGLYNYSGFNFNYEGSINMVVLAVSEDSTDVQLSRRVDAILTMFVEDATYKKENPVRWSPVEYRITSKNSRESYVQWKVTVKNDLNRHVSVIIYMHWLDKDGFELTKTSSSPISIKPGETEITDIATVSKSIASKIYDAKVWYSGG